MVIPDSKLRPDHVEDQIAKILSLYFKKIVSRGMYHSYQIAEGFLTEEI